jgi:hypothetical protein
MTFKLPITSSFVSIFGSKPFSSICSSIFTQLAHPNNSLWIEKEQSLQEGANEIFLLTWGSVLDNKMGA